MKIWLIAIFSVAVVAKPFEDKALFLTPLIEAGQIDEAQEKAKIAPENFLNVESYAGYLTVNKKYNSNLYFWFVPALDLNESAPVILWLQGGPGSSSLAGLFTINGPFYMNENYDLFPNNYTWARNNHMLYIDQPVGAGFSFTDHNLGYATNEIEVGRDLYSAVDQFFDLFPKLRSNPFFVFGESYGGKYVPTLGYTILQHDEKKINLQGLGIGNGTPDPYNQIYTGDYLFAIGLYDEKQRDIIRELCKKFQKLIDQQLYQNATDLKYELQRKFENFTGYTNIYNFMDTKNNPAHEVWKKFVIEPNVRSLIHVGMQPFDKSDTVKAYLKADISKSVAPWISELLSTYPVMLYNGQLDMLTPTQTIVNYVKHLNFSGEAEYLNAKRCLWYVDGELAGYIKVGGNLTDVLVRNAGHMVPRDQPKWMFDLLSNFVSKRITCK